MEELIVLFKNKDDENKIYQGDLLTNPENVNEHTLYISVSNPRSFIKNEMDWKKQYVKDIGMDEILYVGTQEKLEKAYPELYILEDI